MVLIEANTERNQRIVFIRAARKTIRENARIEATNPSGIWSFCDGNRDSYWEDFKGLYQGNETFETKLIARRQAGQKVCALDLMGRGTIFSELPIDAGLAVTLADTRSQYETATDARSGFYIVDGWGRKEEKSRDILSKHTWGNIRKWLHCMGFSGFQIIFCRPIAGFNDLPRDPSVFSWLLQQGYSCLDPNGGELLCSVPRRFSTILMSWTNNVATQRGINAIYVGDVLRVVRKIENPDQLPTNNP